MQRCRWWRASSSLPHPVRGLHQEHIRGHGAEDGPHVAPTLEVAQLDLGHVRLATLSACETGLGETAGGEGLLGLQRAFQTAGARSVVGSLWKLSDDAARQLMIDFYDNLWTKKMSKAEALRQSQLSMLREGLKRGAKRLDDAPSTDADERTSPDLWAAFELSGDWRDETGPVPKDRR